MSARFMRRGVSKVFFAPTVASISAVTRSEITSATELTDDIANISGWALTNQPIPTPDLGSTFDSNIPGSDAAANSSFDFYEDKASDTIETLLPKGTAGFVIIMRKGDVPASLSMDVFPVRVATKAPQYSAGNNPALFQVMFSITSEPELDTAVPAAV